MFEDRRDAGRQLAEVLRDFGGQDVVVLGLPRGGVPIAAIVASDLGAPLDVIVVRKLGVPSEREIAMGAIGENGVRALNPSVIHAYGISDETIARVEAREQGELERQLRRLRDGRAPVALSGMTAIVVDDGVATGATALAACEVARALGARRVVFATPVAPRRAMVRLAAVADEVRSLAELVGYFSVGHAYRDFRPVSDGEVTALLEQNLSGDED